MQREQQPGPALQVGQRSLHHRHPAPVATGRPFGLTGSALAGPCRSFGRIAPGGRVSARRGRALTRRVGLNEPKEILGPNADSRGKGLHELHAQGGRWQRQQQRPGFGLQAGTSFGRRQIDPRGQFAQQKLGQRLRGRQCRRKALSPVSPHETVRIMLGRQKEEIDPFGVSGMGQTALKRPPGGSAPGSVAIEGEHHPVNQPQQLLCMQGRGGGPQGRHGIANTVLGEHDHIHIAFNDDDAVGRADGIACLEQAVELAAFREQRSLGRVEVLRLALAHHPAAESDHLTARIADREHDAVAKPVVATPTLPLTRSNYTVAVGAIRIGIRLRLDDQPGRNQSLGRVIGHGRLEATPSVRRITDGIPGGGFATHPTPLQIIDGRRRFPQPRLVELRGGSQGLEQVGVTPDGIARRRLLRHSQSGRPGKLVNGIDIAEAGLLHQKPDRRAMHTAAEAVIKLFCRRNRERR